MNRSLLLAVLAEIKRYSRITQQRTVDMKNLCRNKMLIRTISKSWRDAPDKFILSIEQRARRKPRVNIPQEERTTSSTFANLAIVLLEKAGVCG